MTKTLKQILGEKPILFTADVPERVKEWLTQKRQEAERFRVQGYVYYELELIDELLEELEK